MDRRLKAVQAAKSREAEESVKRAAEEKIREEDRERRRAEIEVKERAEQERLETVRIKEEEEARKLAEQTAAAQAAAEVKSQSQRLDNKLRPLQQHRVKMSGSKRNGRKIVVMIVAVRVN